MRVKKAKDLIYGDVITGKIDGNVSKKIGPFKVETVTKHPSKGYVRVWHSNNDKDFIAGSNDEFILDK